jgi:hypothetical protein
MFRALYRIATTNNVAADPGFNANRIIALGSRQGAANMRIAGNIAGHLLVLIGAVWALQDLNLLGGSFMTGQFQWFIIGIAVAIIGITYYAE